MLHKGEDIGWKIKSFSTIFEFNYKNYLIEIVIMNECLNFFKYAKLSDIDEIKNLVYENSEWFSHLSKDHFIKKINNKECIYESGVLISFKIIKTKTLLGNFNVPAGNTILEQIIKNKKKSNSGMVFHVFTKFINCALVQFI